MDGSKDMNGMSPPKRKRGRRPKVQEHNNNQLPLIKGPWSTQEDEILSAYVRRHGEGAWNRIQSVTTLRRDGKSCRFRWLNHLRPNLKKDHFTPEEERLVIELQARMGNKWSQMAKELPGRTDNEIKNFWNTRMKRRKRAGLPLYPSDIRPRVEEERPDDQNGGAARTGKRQNTDELQTETLQLPEIKSCSQENFDFLYSILPCYIKPTSGMVTLPTNTQELDKSFPGSDAGARSEIIPSNQYNGNYARIANENLEQNGLPSAYDTTLIEANEKSQQCFVPDLTDIFNGPYSTPALINEIANSELPSIQFSETPTPWTMSASPLPALEDSESGAVVDLPRTMNHTVAPLPYPQIFQTSVMQDDKLSYLYPTLQGSQWDVQGHLNCSSRDSAGPYTCERTSANASISDICQPNETMIRCGTQHGENNHVSPSSLGIMSDAENMFIPQDPETLFQSVAPLPYQQNFETSVMQDDELSNLYPILQGTHRDVQGHLSYSSQDSSGPYTCERTSVNATISDVRQPTETTIGCDTQHVLNNQLSPSSPGIMLGNEDLFAPQDLGTLFQPDFGGPIVLEHGYYTQYGERNQASPSSSSTMAETGNMLVSRGPESFFQPDLGGPGVVEHGCDMQGVENNQISPPSPEYEKMFRILNPETLYEPDFGGPIVLQNRDGTKIIH